MGVEMESRVLNAVMLRCGMEDKINYKMTTRLADKVSLIIEVYTTLIAKGYSSAEPKPKTTFFDACLAKSKK